MHYAVTRPTTINILHENKNNNKNLLKKKPEETKRKRKNKWKKEGGYAKTNTKFIIIKNKLTRK